MISLAQLAASWRERSAGLQRFNEGASIAFGECAAALEAALAELEMEELDVAAAAAESGYTRVHIRRMIADGTLPNAGTAEEPRVLRANLPRKPGHGIVAPKRPTPVLSMRQDIVRAALHGGR